MAILDKHFAQFSRIRGTRHLEQSTTTTPGRFRAPLHLLIPVPKSTTSQASFDLRHLSACPWWSLSRRLSRSGGPLAPSPSVLLSGLVGSAISRQGGSSGKLLQQGGADKGSAVLRNICIQDRKLDFVLLFLIEHKSRTGQYVQSWYLALY